MDVFAVRRLEVDAVADVGVTKGTFTDIDDALAWAVTCARADVFSRVIVERSVLNDIVNEPDLIFTIGPIARRRDADVDVILYDFLTDG